MKVNDTDAIIDPSRIRPLDGGGPFWVMAATEKDLKRLAKAFGYERQKPKSLLLSRVYLPDPQQGWPALAGPMIGAPYATIVLEHLIACGAREIVFVGWCGAVSPDVHIGDIILPTGAFSDEGTSVHYGLETEDVHAGNALCRAMARVLAQRAQSFHQGMIWTTDAVFRETRGKVLSYQARGALAVEMEVAALLSVARFRGVDLCALLVVSDELSDLRWRPGFSSPEFKAGCGSACEAIQDLCFLK